jgi:hypothetical protein
LQEQPKWAAEAHESRALELRTKESIKVKIRSKEETLNAEAPKENREK